MSEDGYTRIVVRYGIGYGTHTMELDLESDVTDEEIAEIVNDSVMERVSFGWEREE